LQQLISKLKTLVKMKKTILMLMAMLMMMSAKAQVNPTVLGDKYAMLKVKQGQKYLLLPVQESEDIAAIAVLDGKNEMSKRLNVKLAIDRVDYFVPLELKGAKLLDIEFHGDRRQKGAVGEFVCWKKMKYSETFDTTNREHFRPLYHHTPVYGWMNDPNGMFYKDGVWHLYYQWNPYGSQWENMTWGHSTSRDLIHWEAQPTAIEADWLGSIFSGSCVTNGDEVVAMYTSAGHHQTQSIAVSKDGGRTFTKYAGNPVLTTSDVADFRDPRPFWNEDIKAWNLILAAGQEMRIYSSKDLKEWKYESSFGKEYGNHGGVWECPDLFEIKNEKLGMRNWVLICNINPGGPFGGSATQYFVGQFDGHKFTCESKPEITKWLDYGKDHYATVSFYNAPDNRRTVLAWMSNWQYANQVPTKQFRSANSIPRDLGLFQHGEETYVSVVPSKEMLAVRGAKVKQPTEACEIVIDVKKQAEIVLSNAKGEQVTMKYDGLKQTFTMDRTKSGDVSFSEAFPCVTEAPTYGTIKQLRIFIDRCSIEAFDADGKMAMTNLVFPSEPYNSIKVKGGKATIYQIEN
jgi:levanase/fructan beta-fructosidase